MFKLYSSWNDYSFSDFLAEDDITVSLSSYRGFEHVNEKDLNSDNQSPVVEPQNVIFTYGPAVELKNVTFTYDKKTSAVQTLNGVDLTVPSGQIYGLLGPSGCGKTTLIRCVVGRLKPDSGSVKVLGKVPCSSGSFVPGSAIGYMPQDLALFPDFTIAETLLYFGRLFRMKENAIEQRTQFLTTFLELPNSNRLVANLSGGQKRRVSLAVSLIHSPSLLVLDEPTVGVDPVLREVIWNYLVSLAKLHHITVIITTHYIEEARQAHVVGLMRFGRLLTEASPDYLMKYYSAPTLEDVFLKLCQLDTSNQFLQSWTPEKRSAEFHKDVENNDLNVEPCQETVNSSSDLQLILTNDSKSDVGLSEGKFDRRSNAFTSVCRTAAMCRKNWTRLRRNIPFLLYQFLLPSFEILLFAICIGKDPFSLPLAIHNAENSSNTYMLSTEFLNLLDNRTFVKNFYDSNDAAIDSVRKGEAWAALTFHHNFSRALQMRTMLGSSADNETLLQSEIALYLDLSNKIIGTTIERKLLETFQTFAEKMLNETGLNPLLAQLPLSEKAPIYGSKTEDFTEFMAPGMLLSTVFISAVALTALSFVMERKEGLLERSLVAGVNPFEFLMSHVLTQLSVLSVQLILLLIFTFGIFLTCKGPLLWAILLTWLQGTCGMAYGLIISSICKDENSATMLALGSMYPNLILNGTVWPTQAMPKIVRYLAYLMPQTYPIESLRYIVSRGWGWNQIHPEITAGFLISILWTIAMLIVAGFLFKRSV